MMINPKTITLHYNDLACRACEPLLKKIFKMVNEKMKIEITKTLEAAMRGKLAQFLQYYVKNELKKEYSTPENMEKLRAEIKREQEYETVKKLEQELERKVRRDLKEKLTPIVRKEIYADQYDRILSDALAEMREKTGVKK